MNLQINKFTNTTICSNNKSLRMTRRKYIREYLDCSAFCCWLLLFCHNAICS